MSESVAPAVDPKTFDSAERRIITVTSAAHLLCHFFMLVFPAMVMPISRDLGVPVAQVLSISFLMYVLYGLLALPWGWVSDRLGHRWAMGAGMALAGLGFLAAALARQTAAISASFAVVGIGCSAYHPAGLALVSQGVRQRGRALGINGLFGNLGIAVTPFAVGVLNYLLGWRQGLAVVGLLGLAVGALALSFPLAASQGEDRKPTAPLEPRAARILFVTMIVGLVFSGLVYRSFTVILPTFLEHRIGNLTAGFRGFVEGRLPAAADTGAVATLAANLTATLVYLLGMAGQLIGGRIADRHSLKWAYMLIFLCTLPFITAMAVLQGAPMVLAGGLFVMFYLGVQPIENSLIAYLTPAKWRSVSYGVKFTVTFGVGALAVKLMAAVEGSWGIDRAIWPIPVLMLLLVANTGVLLLLSRGRDLRH